ncbi:MAG: MBL fold metallo-hydrolase [Desulfovibrionaceae bacterium]
MDVTVVYIHHNCFILLAAGRTLLFDYPSAAHLPPVAAAAARPHLDGADLVVFVSHGHADHCAPDLPDVTATARTRRWVLSYDVPAMFPAYADLADAVVVEPEETAQAPGMGGMEITGIESMDQGVGFLVAWQGKRLFFGGDVALWTWDRMDARASAHAEAMYWESLAPVLAAPLDLAFHNADRRLGNWAGGEAFFRRAAPRYFVPMHAFGDTASLHAFADKAALPPGQWFRYAAPGDTWRITL